MPFPHSSPKDPDFHSPLYLAPHSTFSDTPETTTTTCLFCREPRPFLIRLISTDYIFQPCTHCQSPVPQRIGRTKDPTLPATCLHCGQPNNFLITLDRKHLHTCPKCLTAGRAALSHETEIGYISYDYTQYGAIEVSSDRLKFKSFAVETFSDGSQSKAVLFDPTLLKEMHRTPRYFHLQREYWPLHCNHFMSYLGNPTPAELNTLSNGQGRAFLRHHLPTRETEMAEDYWSWLEDEMGVSYLHQCQTCHTYKIFVDSD